MIQEDMDFSTPLTQKGMAGNKNYAEERRKGFIY
jgi:hypothetical protein